jgi:sugar phosphate isomerase/epimerase
MLRLFKTFKLTPIIFIFQFVVSMGLNAQSSFGGLALYTLRDELSVQLEQTLKQVSEEGYAYVEAASYKDRKFYGLSPKDFKSLLVSLNLKGISTHQGGVTLNNADQMIADVKAAGFTYFVVPVPPMGMFTYDRETMTMGMKGTAKELLDILNVLGKKCHAAGLQLLYHNHDFELIRNENNVIILDYLLENTDPKYVNFQMDLFWVSKAGVDPIDYFNKYPGRFLIWHVKDMDDKGRFAPVGEGKINFKRILAQKERSGMKYYMVEQDMTFDGLKPLEAIKISHKGLKAFGFDGVQE